LDNLLIAEGISIMGALDESKIKLSQLRALVAVANHSNFSAAALAMGLNQSTLSHAIATLEEELGVVLLVRGRHGATPTPVGEQIIQDARQILTLLESIHHKARLEHSLEDGKVRIASVRSVATHLLPTVIAQFRKSYATIRVSLNEYDLYNDVEQALRSGRADVGCTTLPAGADFQVWTEFPDEFVALLPPDSLPEDAPLTWETLTQFPMIMGVSTMPRRHTRDVQNHLNRFGHRLTVAYEVREDSTIISMVRQGLGATIMARLAAIPVPDDIIMRPLPVPLERTIGAITLADALLPRAAFAFLDTLKQVWNDPKIIQRYAPERSR
jgi:DNA-binding transcriptional LysR family regulator